MIDIKIIAVDTIPAEAVTLYYPAPLYLTIKAGELIGYSLKSDLDTSINNAICIRNIGKEPGLCSEKGKSQDVK